MTLSHSLAICSVLILSLCEARSVYLFTLPYTLPLFKWRFRFMPFVLRDMQQMISIPYSPREQYRRAKKSCSFLMYAKNGWQFYHHFVRTWGLLHVRCRERGPITTHYRQNPDLRDPGFSSSILLLLTLFSFWSVRSQTRPRPTVPLERLPLRKPRQRAARWGGREMLSHAPATAGAVEVGVRAARRARGGTRRTTTTPPF